MNTLISSLRLCAFAAVIVTGKPVGLLINFHSRFLKDGIKRYILSQNLRA